MSEEITNRDILKARQIVIKAYQNLDWEKQQNFFEECVTAAKTDEEIEAELDYLCRLLYCERQEFYGGISGIFASWGEDELSFEAQQKVIDLKPEDPHRWQNLGITYMESGIADEEALQMFEKVIQADPQLDVYTYQAQVLNRLERYEEALEALEKAAPLHADDEVNEIIDLEEKAYALYQSGRVNEAVAAYERIIKINIDIPVAYYGLGLILFDEGQLESAMEYFEWAKGLIDPDAEDHQDLEQDLDESLNEVRRELGIFSNHKPLYPRPL